jgi:hypothetical protein
MTPRLLLTASALLLAACGGGQIDNEPATTTGNRLSFVYYQRCIEPILQAQLDVNIGGEISRNSCAGAGCHSNTSGTGGALRVVPKAAVVDLDDPANTPDVVRTLDIYKNFYSAQGEVVPGNPGGSRLLNKPLVRNVLHGGGLIFESADDANARLIAYWINRPTPEGQDEFSTSAASMFTPPDPTTGTCNTE